jgi:3-hydroxymyristoyl/3-hydroxydecanoyl-(acyl carrier protein) dehydratase
VLSLPADSQGKKKKEEVEALFGSDILMSRLLSGEKAVEQSAGKDGSAKAVLDFSVPGASDYFDDHFPQMRLLPAVAQFELAVRFANRYLGTGLGVLRAKRLKFSSPVLPEKPLRMEITRAGDTVSFTLSNPGGDTVYSSGTFAAGNEQ